MNLDQHDPQFCFDNYQRLVRTINETFANSTCPVGDDAFSGAPPSVSIVCVVVGGVWYRTYDVL